MSRFRGIVTPHTLYCYDHDAICYGYANGLGSHSSPHNIRVKLRWYPIYTEQVLRLFFFREEKTHSLQPFQISMSIFILYSSIIIIISKSYVLSLNFIPLVSIICYCFNINFELKLSNRM